MISRWRQLYTSLPPESYVSFHRILKNNMGTEADVWKCELQPPTKNNPKLTQHELQRVCLRGCVRSCVCGSMLEWARLSKRGYDFLKDFINVSLADPDLHLIALPATFHFFNQEPRKRLALRNYLKEQFPYLQFLNYFILNHSI